MPVSLGIWDRLPDRTKRILTRLLHPSRLGSLRRTSPISTKWGKDRGTPVDRYYIDQFLDQNKQHIHGRVLEVGAKTYTDRFGTDVSRCDVFDKNPANTEATLFGDLEMPLEVQSNQFDCLLLTQVLQFIYYLPPCIAELHRILRPDGALLATLPCVSRIDPSYGIEKDYWRFTASACQRLFEESFGVGQVLVESYGNVLSSIAFLEGIAYEELSTRELDVKDPMLTTLIGVRAVKC